MDPPQVISTLLPASDVPDTTTPADFSSAFTTLFCAIASIKTGAGLSVSIVTGRLEEPNAAPDASTIVAVIVRFPSAGRSARPNSALQFPSRSVCAVTVAAPQTMRTRLLAGARPFSTIPFALSAAFTMSSPITGRITGAVRTP